MTNIKISNSKGRIEAHNAYDDRNAFKSRGFRFDGYDKCWHISFEQATRDYALLDFVARWATVELVKGLAEALAGRGEAGRKALAYMLSSSRFQAYRTLIESVYEKLNPQQQAEPQPQPQPAAQEAEADLVCKAASEAGVQLFPHQVAAAVKLLKAYRQREGGFLLADAPRVGKTFSILAFLKVAKAPALVISPASVVGMWREQLARWGVEGVAVSYDTFRSRYESEYKNAAANKILVLDEAHRVKNSKAIITKRVAEEAKHAAFVIAATGTPFQNEPTELLTVLKTARVKEHKVVYIAAEWQKDRFATRLVWRGAAAMAQLKERLSEAWWYLRRELKDVALSMPALTRETLIVSADSLNKHLKQIDTELEALAEKYRADDKLAQAERVDRVRAGLFDVEDLSALFPIASTLRRLLAKAKLQAVSSVVEDALEQTDEGEGVLFFAHHEEVISELRRALKDVAHDVIDGSVDAAKRQDIMKRFQAGELKALILSTRAAGEGLTLSRASLAVFVELDWNPAVLTQAENRIMNINDARAKIARYIVAPHALERRMVQLVNEKAHAAEAVYASEGSVAKLSDAAPTTTTTDPDDDPTPPTGGGVPAEAEPAEADREGEIDFITRVADEVLLEDASAPSIAATAPVTAEPFELVPPPPYTPEPEPEGEEEATLPPDPRQVVLPLWGPEPSLGAGTAWEQCVGGGFEPLFRPPRRSGRTPYWGRAWELHVKTIHNTDKLLVIATSQRAEFSDILTLEEAYSFISAQIKVMGLPQAPEPSTRKVLERLGWLVFEESPKPSAGKGKDPLPPRQARVGFSEIATVMGANPYKSSYELWQEKTGRKPADPQTLAMEWGSATEKQAMNLFLQREWGMTPPVWARGRNYQKPAAAIDAPLAGVVDFIVKDPAGERVVVEVKVSGSGVGLEMYKLQVNAQLGALGLRKGYIVMLVSNRYFVVEEVLFDSALYEKQKQAARDFMHCVETDTPPVPPLPVEDDLTAPGGGSIYTEDEDFTQLVAQAKALQEQLSEIDEKLEALKKQIRERLETSALTRVRTRAGVVELKLIESERFDTKRFKASHPELAKQYIKTTTYTQLKLL